MVQKNYNVCFLTDTFSLCRCLCTCVFTVIRVHFIFFQRLFLNTRKETVTSHVLNVGRIKTTPILDAIETNEKKKWARTHTLTNHKINTNLNRTVLYACIYRTDAICERVSFFVVVVFFLLHHSNDIDGQYFCGCHCDDGDCCEFSHC